MDLISAVTTKSVVKVVGFKLGTLTEVNEVNDEVVSEIVPSCQAKLHEN